MKARTASHKCQKNQAWGYHRTVKDYFLQQVILQNLEMKDGELEPDGMYYSS